MVAMNDSTRRLIMMMTIILAGTAVTFLELDPAIVFIISLAIGLVMLFGLNILSFDELKEDLSLFRERLNQPISLKKSKDEKAEKGTPEVKQEAGPKPGKESKKREIPFSGLIEKLPFKRREKKETGIEKAVTTAEKASFLSGLIGKIKSRENSEDKTKKIDELLDKAINDPVVSPEQTGEAPVSTKEEVEEDDFSDFDDLDLGLEDEDSGLEFDDEEIAVEPGAGGGTPPAAGVEEEIPDSTIADILAKEGIDFDLDSDNEFPGSAGDEEESGTEGKGGKGLGDLDELDSDISGLDLEEDEMDEFDQIDLDEIEPEEEIDFEEEEDEIELGDSEEEVQDVVVAPPEESDDILSAPPKEWTQSSQVPGQEEFTPEEPSLSLSFGGGGDEEDLFAMLKSDTKKAVVVQELSLVRGMKDMKVESGELVDGLESVLNHLGVKVEKIEEEEDSNPQAIIEDENGVQ